MGKSLIILGADFSANGIVAQQTIGVLTEFAKSATLGGYTWIFSERVSVSGVIKKVSIISKGNGKDFKIKVFKPDLSLRSSTTFTTTKTNGIDDFSASIPVEPGDYIAYWGATTGAVIPYDSNSPKTIYYVLGDVSSISLDNHNTTQHAIRVEMSI